MEGIRRLEGQLVRNRKRTVFPVWSLYYFLPLHRVQRIEVDLCVRRGPKGLQAHRNIIIYFFHLKLETNKVLESWIASNKQRKRSVLWAFNLRHYFCSKMRTEFWYWPCWLTSPWLRFFQILPLKDVFRWHSDGSDQTRIVRFYTLNFCQLDCTLRQKEGCTKY